MKGSKWKIIVPLVIVAVLAFAFWYGGGPRHGWTVSQETAPPSPTATPASTQASVTTVPPERLPPVETPTAPPPEGTPTPEPSPTPTPAAELSPTPLTVKPTPTAEPTPESSPTATPVPSEEPQKTTVTVSISCATLLDHLDELDEGIAALVPPDGWLLAPTEMDLEEGASVFDLLEQVCRDNQIHMEFSNTPLYNSAYIEGIGNLYEFDCGEQSGWMYAVNGAFPNYGCSEYVLEAGDTVEWAYTRDLGKDLGQ